MLDAVDVWVSTKFLIWRLQEKVWKISLQLFKRHQVSLLGPALGVSTKCFEFLQKAGIVKRASQYYHLKSENRITIQ